MVVKSNLVSLGVVLLFACLPGVGCETGEPVKSLDTAPVVNQDSIKTPAENDSQGEGGNKEEESGLMDLATNLVKKAQDLGGDAMDQANDKGAETVDWVNQMYQSLKDRGLTTAKDATEWVQEDFSNLNAVEYKILQTTMTDVEEFETQMNELGKNRWECFHVQERDGTTTFFFKKPKRSYMRNIPLKDMVRLVPFMGGQ